MLSLSGDERMSVYYAWTILLRDVEDWMDAALRQRFQMFVSDQAVLCGRFYEDVTYRRAESALLVLYCSLDKRD